MAIGRFSCDYLRRVYGRNRVLKAAGVLSGFGLALAAMAPSLPSPVSFACLGILLVGFGLSTLLPIVFSSAGHLPGIHPGSSIAIVETFAYTALIVCGPFVGALSDALGQIRYALLVVAVMLVGVTFLAFGVAPEPNEYDQKKAAAALANGDDDSN